jgi:murein DD-endopeptidase MepM/ murein hydrolase activator NlpD
MPVSILPTPRGPSAYWYVDPEGAPSPSGARFHAALDWFAAGDTAVRSPVRGEVVEIRPSRGNTGQVFGGVVKVREPQGRVFVMRHVDPLNGLRVGDKVLPGGQVAWVTNWRDGPDHVHLEIWRVLSRGYWQPNMIDPNTLKWEPYLNDPVVPPLPEPPHGNTLRIVLGERDWAGWPEAAGALRWIAAHGVDPHQGRAALSWRGKVYRGSRQVTNAAKSLVKQFLEEVS